MSLIAHYPLKGDMNDYSGNENHLSFYGDGSTLPVNNLGKIGKCYERLAVNNSNDHMKSANTIDLQGDFTLAIWCYATDLHDGTANGLLNFHYHGDNSGAGINLRHVSADDFRISCNTGTGSGRTYYTHYGTSNVKDRWAHLILRFIKATNTFSLWVDGVKEKEWVYSQYNRPNYITVFHWSVQYINTSYNPAVKLNDARVYDHALSHDEIIELAKAKVLHYDFNHMEEAKENYIADAINMPGWGSYSNGNDGTYMTEFGTIGYQMIDRGSWNGIYKDFVLPGPGIYTFSAWFKYLGGDSVNNGATVYVSGYGGGDTARTLDKSKINEWQRVSHTVNVTEDPPNVRFYIISYGGTNGVDTSNWRVTMPQIEKGGLTPFIDNLRDAVISDSSGYGNDAVNDGAVWEKDLDGHGSGKYVFDGISAKMNIPSTFRVYGKNSYTFAAWVKLDPSWSAEGCILAGRRSTTNSFVVAADRKLRVGMDDAHGYGVGVLNTNQWYHVAGVVDVSDDGTIMTATTYINGEQDGQNTHGSYVDVFDEGSNYIGYDWRDPYYWFNGEIADVQVYATALSPEAIKKLANNRAVLTQDGDLFINELVEVHSKHFDESLRHSGANHLHVYAKKYPTDGSAPLAGVYMNGSQVYDYGRDWHLSVWDLEKDTWATGVDFCGATSVSGAHARYDIYNSSTRVAQNAALAETLTKIDSKYLLIIGASHAPEWFDTAVRDAVIDCGGTLANMSWYGVRSSYVCIGQKGAGEGGAYYEALNNLNQDKNGGSNWARADLWIQGGKISLSPSGAMEAIEFSEVGVVDDTIMGYWDLREGTYDLARHNDMLNTNVVMGSHGGHFDGSAALSCPHDDSLVTSSGYISMVALVEWESSDGDGIVSCKEDDYEWRITPGGIFQRAIRPDWRWDGSLIVSANTPTFIASVWNNSEDYLYVNAQKETITGGTRGLQDGSAWTRGLGIGDRGVATDGSPEAFTTNEFFGRIYYVKIFDRKLTDEEIQIEREYALKTLQMRHDGGVVGIPGEFKEGL